MKYDRANFFRDDQAVVFNNATGDLHRQDREIPE